MRRHTAGVTIAESLLAAIMLLIAAASFAVLATQAARTTSSSQLATYGADAMNAAASAVQRGNPRYLQAMTLSAEDLQLLASAGGRRAALRPALRGSVTPLGGDPPRYLITVQGPDFELKTTATAPGGSP